MAVEPEVFADFLVRHQRLHPESRLEGAAVLPLVLEQLRGFAAEAGLWEAEILPRRLRDYRPAWLDDALVATVAGRCKEVESGARNVDHILTGTLLPELAGEFLARMAEGTQIRKVHVTVDGEGKFAYQFE